MVRRRTDVTNKVNTTVPKSGMGGCVYMPKTWIGKKVKMILLSTILVSTFILLVSNSQVLKAATWSPETENWVSQKGKTFLSNCIEQTIVRKAYVVFENYTKVYMIDRALQVCDNDLLILKLDVCPNHANKYTVCHEIGLPKYIHDRELDSVTVTPIEWWSFTHPEKSTN
jgi:putative transposon-encoded protein